MGLLKYPRFHEGIHIVYTIDRNLDGTLAAKVQSPDQGFGSVPVNIRELNAEHFRVFGKTLNEVQFYDLTVRLKNAYAVRDRVQKLLDSAKTVPDALAVERELERIAGDIERMEGKLKLMRELIAFSTITVEYQARATDQVGSSVNLPFPWLEQLGLGNLMSL